MAGHAGPYANAEGIIVQETSDKMFGPEGLGFAGTPWTTLISWLARNGISRQTASQPNETVVKNCVAGWGQGAFSSRVFLADGSGGWDDAQLERLINHLGEIARTLEGDATRINSAAAAAFIGSQDPKPYQTFNGIQEARGFVAKAEARFRGHIQWQSLVAFAGETSFFTQMLEHRQKLCRGEIQPGAPDVFLDSAETHIDRAATDRAYIKTKSGLWLILKITFYMITRKGAQIAPLH